MQPVFIGLAGPSGAGKTTLVRHITENYPHITHIRLDGFFKPYETFPMHGDFVNRETPENIYWDDFYAALSTLRAGEPTIFPLYEKKTGVQCGTELITPGPVVFVEGYLLYHDPRISNLLDAKLYLHVSPDEQYRRKKARWPEMDDAYFYQVVVPMFEQYGSRGAHIADTIINGDAPANDVIAELEKTSVFQRFLSKV
jgi:uridine kinase